MSRGKACVDRACVPRRYVRRNSKLVDCIYGNRKGGRCRRKKAPAGLFFVAICLLRQQQSTFKTPVFCKKELLFRVRFPFWYPLMNSNMQTLAAYFHIPSSSAGTLRAASLRARGGGMNRATHGSKTKRRFVFRAAICRAIPPPVCARRSPCANTLRKAHIKKKWSPPFIPMEL